MFLLPDDDSPPQTTIGRTAVFRRAIPKQVCTVTRHVFGGGHWGVICHRVRRRYESRGHVPDPFYAHSHAHTRACVRARTHTQWSVSTVNMAASRILGDKPLGTPALTWDTCPAAYMKPRVQSCMLPGTLDITLKS